MEVEAYESQSQINSLETELIHRALKALNIDDFVLIIHGGSLPKSRSRDTGFGSPYGKDAEQFAQFARTLGFNGIQLGPAGKTKSVDRSPYTGTLFSGNPLFIDFFQLLDVPGFNLLVDRQMLQNIVSENPNLGEDRIAYEFLYDRQQSLLNTVFKTYQQLLQQKNSDIQDIAATFQRFQSENADWLHQDALYEALSFIHGNDYWPHWKLQTDRELLSGTLPEALSRERISEILDQAGDVYESYQFAQFLLDLQKKRFSEFCKSIGFKLIADHQVAFSDRDKWANQSYFLDGYKLGAPPDYFSKSGQAWGFPVLDPRQCFDEQGQPLPGATFFQRLFSKVFSDNQGGVRIDHIIGLIDPWVYPQGGSPKPEDGAARLYSSPDHHDLCHYTHVWHEDIDWDKPRDDEDWVARLSEAQVEKYARFIDLVLQAADEIGAPHSGIICEDLGTLTHPVKTVLQSRQLSGIRITQFVDPDVENHLYRGSRVEEQHWIMPGSHDNKPLLLWVDDVFKDKALLASHARLLADDLVSYDVDENVRHQLFEQLCVEKQVFFNYKLAEVFASGSRHVQLFFADLFGIKKYYNRPGLSGRDSWTLRLPSDYQALYDEHLQAGLACQLPTVLAIALNAQSQEFRETHQDLIRQLETLSERVK